MKNLILSNANRKALISFISAFHANGPISLLVGKVAKLMYSNSTYVAHSGTIVNAESWYRGYRLTVSGENGIFTIETTGRHMGSYSLVSIDGLSWEPSLEIERAARAEVRKVRKSEAYTKLTKIFALATVGDSIYRGIYMSDDKEPLGAWWEVISVSRKVQRSGTFLQLQNTDNPKDVIECNAARFIDANPKSTYCYQINHKV